MTLLSLANRASPRGHLTGTDCRMLAKLLNAIDAVSYDQQTPFTIDSEGRLRIGEQIDGLALTFETSSRKPGDTSAMPESPPSGHLDSHDRVKLGKFLAGVVAIGVAGDPTYALGDGGCLQMEFRYTGLALTFASQTRKRTE